MRWIEWKKDVYFIRARTYLRILYERKWGVWFGGKNESGEVFLSSFSVRRGKVVFVGDYMAFVNMYMHLESQVSHSIDMMWLKNTWILHINQVGGGVYGDSVNVIHINSTVLRVSHWICMVLWYFLLCSVVLFFCQTGKSAHFLTNNNKPQHFVR